MGQDIRAVKKPFRQLALVVAITFACSWSTRAQPNPSDVVFKKDVKQYITQGEKTKDVNVVLTIGGDGFQVARSGSDVTMVPFAAIRGATYDRRERQRKIMGLPAGPGYTPKRQHFLTVQFKTGDTGEFVELELGKDIAGRVVATLEARSGKKVEKIGS